MSGRITEICRIASSRPETWWVAGYRRGGVVENLSAVIWDLG